MSSEQVHQANLSQANKNNIEVAVNFERTNWATGSVASDPFYSLPDDIAANFSSLQPGTILKVEPVTNTSLYTLAPTLALSRILFTSETFNGTTIPASAFILWPFAPNIHPNTTTQIQTVVWAHGTSGSFGDCAPSHLRSLWYGFSAPYPLALAGYAVVAPDYQGLGVAYTIPPGATAANASARTPLRSPWYAHAAMANDLIHAHTAARAAFPAALTPEFVVLGHSQGGGVAWAAAERQASRPTPGYLGTVAISPAADYARVLAARGGSVPMAQGPLLAWSATAVFPEFELGEVLTELGERRLGLLAELGGCMSARAQVLGVDVAALLREGWAENWFVRRYFELTGAGGREVAAPMLVVQGTADPQIPVETVTETVGETCARFPGSRLEYLVINGTTHTPTMLATQRRYLGWISDRFAGVPVEEGCRNSSMESYFPADNYQKDGNYFLQWATQGYTVA